MFWRVLVLAIFMLGQPAKFKELMAGQFSVCLLPLPSGLQGMAAMSYATEHGDDLPCYCKAVKIEAAPEEQSTTLEVEIPPMIEDES